jgi:hypothetical protein
MHLTIEQAVTIFQRPKPKNRSWGEHYIYLVEVSHAGGVIHKLDLESIFKYASPELRPTIMARVNMSAPDWLLEAETLDNFDQAKTLDERLSRTLGQ